jgi:hypothetical protein
MTLHAALMAVMLTAAAAGGAASVGAVSVGAASVGAASVGAGAGGPVANGANTGGAVAQSGPPADDASAKARLAESSRHGEYVDIAVPGRATPIRAFAVYPEIATKAPVVIVLHETYGLTDWIRGVADQLAAEGFIAIAPELAAGAAPSTTAPHGASPNGATPNGTTPNGATPNGAALQAVHAYGAKLPASTGKTTTLLLQGPPRLENWAGTVDGLRKQTQ